VSAPLTVYADSLLGQLRGEDRGAGAIARYRDGTARPLLLERWLRAADVVDERALRRLLGPVLDVGCGPGRHLHALARRGVFGLGVDLSPAAVALATGGGARAIVGSIFDDLPGTGRWRSALLLDGNIGIGGSPARLLRRVGRLLSDDGQVLVELSPPHTATVETAIRLETSAAISDWFPWADVSASDIAGVAALSGCAVTDGWTESDRWFALLRAA
jgi:SAM-dependent methyltransferase